jgi:glutaredoxin
VLAVELESLGAKGKAVRAELAKRTGRTSMPCIFVNGQPIGGYTDGVPIGVGLQVLHETGELRKMLDNHNKQEA